MAGSSSQQPPRQEASRQESSGDASIHQQSEPTQRTPRRWNRRHAWLAALGVALVGLGPLTVAYIRHELAVSEQLDALASELPHKTELLKVGTAVDAHGPTGCRGIAAKMLATELAPRAVGDFYAPGSNAIRIAFSSPDGFHVRNTAAQARAESVTPEQTDTLPDSVHHLLTQHAFLPEGVRRVVVFSTLEMDSGLDLRCL